MTVVDNSLDDDKIGHLKKFIEVSGVKEFSLKNVMDAVQDHSDYSKFRDRITEITKIEGLKYNIEWAHTKLQN